MMMSRVHSKLSIALLSLFLLFAVFITIPPQKAQAQPNTVDLVSASMSGYFGGLFFGGGIEVDNLDYTKQVKVVWRVNSGSWTETSASYVRATTNNHELWSFYSDIEESYEDLSSGYLEFKVKYIVNGITYWDTNGGSNYKLSFGSAAPSFAIGNPPVKVNFNEVPYSSTYFDTTANVAHFGVFVKNLGFTKTVKVRYSTDNWATYTEASLAYDATVSNSGSTLESWKASVPVSSTVNNIKYSISYTVNGVTYWDNDLGLNYELNR
ncbi:hypothetical protein PAECIP111893_02228 [Paenibacillus plantiphilus]|uniref:CBM21 domain-containing protein n=2 Tax=Paenibacillus plantiphilus TaxID=2905650 RepID=A0ABM9C4U7_9BACL|nr:hypothetical protein PAECIP111893_02228 [Paenibacillus plantiphilus]